MNISRILNAIFIFIIIFSIIYILKPSFIFKENGELKDYGVNSNKNQTIFHLGVITCVISILSFWIIAVNDYSNNLIIEELNLIKQLESINDLKNI